MGDDYAVKYSTARERILVTMHPLAWVSWQHLRRIGGVRYSARLLELRRLGYDIEDRSDPSGDGKQYRLTSIERGRPQGKQVKVYLHESDVEAILAGHFVPLRTTDAMAKALRIFKANKHKL